MMMMMTPRGIIEEGFKSVDGSDPCRNVDRM